MTRGKLLSGASVALLVAALVPVPCRAQAELGTPAPLQAEAAPTPLSPARTQLPTSPVPVQPAPAPLSATPVTPLPAPTPADDTLPAPRVAEGGTQTWNGSGEPGGFLRNGLPGPLNPDFGHFSPFLIYGATGFPAEPVRGQPTNLSVLVEDFLVGFPIWQDHCDELTGTVVIRNESFDTNAILPNTHQPFPEELWNIHLAANYRHHFDNGWIAGGTVTFGSASDKPFDTINEYTASILAFLGIPSGEHNAWLFALAYSPTSELAFPVPGVAYIWQPSDNFRMNIGLPFSVWYRPIDDLTFDFSYMLLRTVHARATYHVAKPVCVYAAFDWDDRSYFLADRPDENDRFFYYEKRLSGGLQFFFGPHAMAEAAAGYAFDRFYFEGKSYSDRNFNRIDVGDGPFGTIRLLIRF
jgi:hypothetical protein